MSSVSYSKLSIERVTKVLSVVLVVYGFICIALYLKFSVGMLQSTYQADYGEGFMWYLSSVLAHGHNIYHSLNQSPYVTIDYTPIGYLVPALVIKIFGSSLAAGRTVSFVCSLLCSILIYFIVRRITDRKAPAFLASVFPLSIGFYGTWSMVFRVDMLGLFFTLAGIFIVVKYLDSKKILWSVPCFLLALFTKQGFLAAPLAVMTYLFFKDRKRFYKFTGLMLVGGLLLIGFFTLIFGKYFLIQTFSEGTAPYILKNGISQFLTSLACIPVILSLVIIYIVYKFKEKKWNFLSIYFVWALIFNFILLLQVGTGLNSSLELWSVGAIIVGVLLGNWLKRLDFKRYYQTALIVLLLILPVGMGAFNYNRYVLSGPSTAYTKVESSIDNVSGPVFSEDGTLLMETGKPVLWAPADFVQGNFYKRFWDQTTLVNELSSGYFDLVILNYNVSNWWGPNIDLVSHQRLTEGMATAIVNSYHLDYSITGYWVYSPNR